MVVWEVDKSTISTLFKVAMVVQKHPLLILPGPQGLRMPQWTIPGP